MLAAVAAQCRRSVQLSAGRHRAVEMREILQTLIEIRLRQGRWAAARVATAAGRRGGPMMRVDARRRVVHVVLVLCVLLMVLQLMDVLLHRGQRQVLRLLVVAAEATVVRFVLERVGNHLVYCVAGGRGDGRAGGDQHGRVAVVVVVVHETIVGGGRNGNGRRVGRRPGVGAGCRSGCGGGDTGSRD